MMKKYLLKTFAVTVLLTLLGYPIYSQDSFVTFIEYTEDGKQIKLLETQFRYDVDINSYVNVSFHPDVLAIGDSKILRSPESLKLRKELEDLNELLFTARNDLHRYVESINSLRIQLLKEPRPEIEDKFRQTLRAHGVLTLKLIEFLEPVYKERLENALGPDPSEDVLSLLAEHINDVEKRLRDETDKLIENNKLILKVWCIHLSQDKEPTAIHLNNYDEIEAGSFHLVDKVSFSTTEEEAKHLRQSIAFHEDLRKLITDLGDKDSEIRQIFKEVKDQFFTDLDQIKNLFGTQDLKDLLDEIELELSKLAAHEEINLLAGDFLKLRAELSAFFDLREKYSALLDELSKQTDPTPMFIFDWLQKWIKDFDELKRELENIAKEDRIDKIKELVKNINDTLERIALSLPQKLREKIEEFIKEKTQTWMNLFSKLKSVFEKYDNLFFDYKTIFEGLKSRLTFVERISEEVPPIQELLPDEIIEVALKEAVPTLIDIPRTNRQENDVYNLHVQIYRDDSSLVDYEYSFRIKKYGVYSKWTGNLIFAKGEWQKSFQPATAVSWILHHRSRPKEKNGKGSGGVLGNVLNLGFGLNSALFSTSGDIEYGLGFVITLFNDIIQIGYGINFQKEEKRGYFFVGASLFDLLNKTR